MKHDLRIFNRQKTRRIDARLLKRVLAWLAEALVPPREVDLTVHLVADPEMEQLNGEHMNHSGSTDVITLDYSPGVAGAPLVGELFVCVDEALDQAARYQVPWQRELCRYVVHGMLHLQGHDDLQAEPKRLMKREENRMVKALERDFDLSKLERNGRLRP